MLNSSQTFRKYFCPPSLLNWRTVQGGGQIVPEYRFVLTKILMFQRPWINKFLRLVVNECPFLESYVHNSQSNLSLNLIPILTHKWNVILFDFEEDIKSFFHKIGLKSSFF